MPVSRGWRLALHNESFMSDNSDNTFTDRYSTKRASRAWEEASSPIVRFRTDDGTCSGFIFHHLEYALDRDASPDVPTKESGVKRLRSLISRSGDVQTPSVETRK